MNSGIKVCIVLEANFLPLEGYGLYLSGANFFKFGNPENVFAWFPKKNERPPL